MEKQNALFEYCLRLADSNLVLSQRLSEWCGHGPILEEDIALTNIVRETLGQATSFLKYAGECESKGRSEDDLAYWMVAQEFRTLFITDNTPFDYLRRPM